MKLYLEHFNWFETVVDWICLKIQIVTRVLNLFSDIKKLRLSCIGAELLQFLIR